MGLVRYTNNKRFNYGTGRELDLIPDAVYTVEDKYFEGEHEVYLLKEIEGTFSTCMFEEVTEDLINFRYVTSIPEIGEVLTFIQFKTIILSDFTQNDEISFLKSEELIVNVQRASLNQYWVTTENNVVYLVEVVNSLT